MQKSPGIGVLAILLITMMGSTAVFLQKKELTTPQVKDAMIVPAEGQNLDKETAAEGFVSHVLAEADNIQETTSNQPASVPQETRQKKKDDTSTACTPAYEDIMELDNNPSVLDSLPSKMTEACFMEISQVIRNFSEVVGELLACGRQKEITPEKARKCLRITNIFRAAFVENEFKDSDPADLPSPVLRAMIIFRTLQMKSYTKTEADLDYFYRLVSEEQRVGTAKDMTSLRSKLLGELINANPEKYQSEFDLVIDDIERSSPEAALSALTMKYHGRTGDAAFQDELESFIQRNPQAPYGYYMKATVLAGKDDWAGADALMVKAIAVSTEEDKSFYEKKRADIAKGEKTFSQRYKYVTSF